MLEMHVGDAGGLTVSRKPLPSELVSQGDRAWFLSAASMSYLPDQPSNTALGYKAVGTPNVWCRLWGRRSENINSHQLFI